MELQHAKLAKLFDEQELNQRHKDLNEYIKRAYIRIIAIFNNRFNNK
jgi:hypothetical protein